MPQSDLIEVTSQVAERVQAGRAAADRHAWRDAYDSLATADAESDLGPEDLELLAETALWSGHLNASIEASERAFAGYLKRGENARAAYVAIMLALDYRNKSATAIAAGWHGRAARLLESEPEAVEHGYLALQKATLALSRGELDDALDEAKRAVELGTRFDDRNVEALGLLRQGVALVKKGDFEEGLMLLDEASAAAVGGDLTPLATGTIYCATIDSCRELGDYARAQQWTDTASRWCDRQAIAGFPGICRVDKAEIMRFNGALADAAREATRACVELQEFNPRIAGAAFAEVGEIRLRLGDLAAAAEAFARADELGRDPQPGRSMLLLIEGKVEAAATSIRCALDEQSWNRLERARLLPAQVEIEIQNGEIERAGAAARELEATVELYNTPALEASAAQACGMVELAEGDAQAALRSLRHARRLWQEVSAPYEGAKTRMLLGLAYRATGDEQAALNDFRAAKAVFERLGTVLDVQRVDELSGNVAPARTFMFTDIVDSTKTAEAIGEVKWKRVLAWHDRTIRELLEAHAGEVIKNTGDGFFAVFDRPARALEAAVAIQRALDAYDGFAPDVRIGLHAGPSFSRDGGDYGGDAVNAAARIGALASGGEILVSRETLAGAPPSFETSEPRSVELKGLSRPLEIVSMAWA